MGMVFSNHIAHDARGLLIGAVPDVSHVVHGIKDAPVHRLQPIAYVREGPADNDAHRVVHIGLTHFVFDVDRDLLLLEGGFHFGYWLLVISYWLLVER